MIKRLLMKTVALAALASTAYTLTLLDQVVQGTLYSYGLQFNYNWANTYWTLLRITWALLAVCAVATTVNTILLARPALEKKQASVKIASTQKMMRDIPMTTQTKEKVSITPPSHLPQPPQKPIPKSTPIIVPPPSCTSPSAPELFKCTHCGKAFTQPLRMLDFQGDPPRIVNVCPFCNENLSSTPTERESEQTEKRSLLNKNNNHVQKPLTH